MSGQGRLGMASVLYHQGPRAGKGMGVRGGAPGRSKQGTLSHTQSTVHSQFRSGHQVATSHHSLSGGQLALGHRQAGNAATKTRIAPYNWRDPRRSRIACRGALLAVNCGVGGEWMRPANYCRAGGMCESKSKRATHHPVSGLLSAGGAKGKTW